MKKFAVLILSIIMVMSFQTAAFAVVSPGHSSSGGGGGGGSSKGGRTTVEVTVSNPVQPTEAVADGQALTEGDVVDATVGEHAVDVVNGMEGSLPAGYGFTDGTADVLSPKTGESGMFAYVCIASAMCFGMAYQARKRI